MIIKDQFVSDVHTSAVSKVIIIDTGIYQFSDYRRRREGSFNDFFCKSSRLRSPDSAGGICSIITE
ncbi:hypothetical protein ZOSMA_10G01380 [Zostera marina]|uniref:Uncharacterized protein n=1 Tax=Zostera marina TaxID=29655 RepID=A0A0K9Q3V8_ZOSMR|nr:hypothetical protein ZOSMA_10G01380 [Zostera marina]